MANPVEENKYRKKVDWEAMRPDWVAGIKTVLQLSEEHAVSRAAILKHWAKLGVDRDLAGKIKAKADALVTRTLVTDQVTAGARVTENEIIDANALNSAAIQINERKDISRARSVAMNLLEELESQVVNKDLYENLGEILGSDDEKSATKLNDIYQKVISFSGRTDNMKKLGETLKTLIDLERRVWKIDGDLPDPGDGRVSVKVNFVDA